MMIPDGAVEEFANTFREWHYLVSGASVGFVAGWIAGSRYAAWVAEDS